MTKFISPANIEIFKEFIPDMYAFGANNIAQLSFLRLIPSQKDIKWRYHPDISSIKNRNIQVTRLVAEALFQNHLLNWEDIKLRRYDLEEYEQENLLDLHEAFYRRELRITTQTKESSWKNLFVYCPDFNIQLFRFKNFLYRKHLNKILCIPQEQLPQMSPQLQKACIELNIKLLPMKVCSHQSILKYIRSNHEGNILISGTLDDHKYMAANSQVKPKEIVIFLDQGDEMDPNRRVEHKKLFPSMDKLLTVYKLTDRLKIDSRYALVDLQLNSSHAKKQKPQETQRDQNQEQ